MCSISERLPRQRFTFVAVLLFELISKTVSANGEKLLQFADILPADSKSYDKMKPPKKDGHATTVHFHVTVMGLDSINEESMVSEVLTSPIHLTILFAVNHSPAIR
ncbi:hypothetical protein TNCT_7631 [Trichonephila clavata]|uniref:Uncharacterized protein n=1 Tax=Trichonephila clavata TaxID=2740835 RepID=A0A8X6LK56_TRICU|nr:hypothetical protein TNCT_7631 [Trichonephila clavata]